MTHKPQLNAIQPTQFFKCLSDDTRLRCLLLVASESELCVCELTKALQLSQPKVSRHLAAMRNSNLLLDRRQGAWVFYTLSPTLPDWCRQILEVTTTAKRQTLSQDLQRLQAMGDRPQRIQSCC